MHLAVQSTHCQGVTFPGGGPSQLVGPILSPLREDVNGRLVELIIAYDTPSAKEGVAFRNRLSFGADRTSKALALPGLLTSSFAAEKVSQSPVGGDPRR